ncbi:hypothetical protein ACN38_g1393 [Penicillium nordicum]|uniref:Uncharacterized protein n=1 Tax=Penicillium nordicum TaxID=229535 RepID=A0A0M8P917_9EURO|nr:hypothetical protein ACN38_g1393 [Penicillium nordicum]
MEKYGGYLHGNPYEDREVCLDRDMLDQQQFTPVTIVGSVLDNHPMHACLLFAIRIDRVVSWPDMIFGSVNLSISPLPFF